MKNAGHWLLPNVRRFGAVWGALSYMKLCPLNVCIFIIGNYISMAGGEPVLFINIEVVYLFVLGVLYPTAKVSFKALGSSFSVPPTYGFVSGSVFGNGGTYAVFVMEREIGTAGALVYKIKTYGIELVIF